MPQLDEFDLDASMDRGWSAFAVRLTDVVQVMEPGAELTIGAIATENPGRSPFVRFTCSDGHRIFAEASSNAELSEEFRLNAEQLDKLDKLGWQAPTSEGDHPTSNFWRACAQEDAEGVVDAAIAALREVFGVPHPAFLAPDQLAEVLTPAPRAELSDGVYPAADVVATMPRDAEHLRAMVEAKLAALLGHEPMRDADSDFAIRVGSSMVFVRVVDDAAEVLVFAVLVHDLEGRSRASEVVNDLNTDARYVRFFVVRDRLFASLSVASQPFVPAHLKKALDTMSALADSIDDHLAHKLHGRTTFPEAPSA